MGRITDYRHLYQWETPIDDHVIGHADGSASLLFTWDGQDNQYLEEAETIALLEQRIAAVKAQEDVVIEHHFQRGPDPRVVDAYEAHTENMVRAHEVGRYIRLAMANHYRPRARGNRVSCVLVARSTNPDAQRLGTRQRLRQWRNARRRLYTAWDLLSDYYPGAALQDCSAYTAFISRSVHGWLNPDTPAPSLDWRFDLAEQLVDVMPRVVDDRLLEVGEHYRRLVLLYNYPPIDTEWFLDYCRSSASFRAVQAVSPKDTQRALDRSAARTHEAGATVGRRDQDLTLKSIGDEEQYRQYIVEHDLKVHDNFYVFDFLGDQDAVLEASKQFAREINAGGKADLDPRVQAHFYRVSQPGHSIYSKFWREDHSATVAAMMPATVFSAGVERPEVLRMTSSYQMVGHSPSRLAVGHEFINGSTGAGKGTQIGTEILETYPFGLDHYLIEFGETQRWVIEGCGGVYTRFADGVHLNPLPPGGELINARGELDPGQVSAVTEALALVLLEGARDYTYAEQAAAERALRALYEDGPGDAAPTLPDFRAAFDRNDWSNDAQARAGADMALRLENFLESSFGQYFIGGDNLVVSDGISGVDISGVPTSHQKFILTFLALRMLRKAFFSIDSVARVWLDELHQLQDSAPQVISRIVRMLQRMGRKEGGQVALSTQGIAEVRSIDDDVFNNTAIYTLLARADQWDEIGELIDLRPGMREAWRGMRRDFENPNFNYRSAIRKIGPTYYYQHLSFPHEALQITTTTRGKRVWKRQIEAQTKDLFERLRLLDEYEAKDAAEQQRRPA